MRKFLSISRIWILALPLIFTFVGAASNQIVLVANHDKFPVMVNSRNVESHGGVDDEGMLDDIHCLMTDKTHLNYLADIFDFKSSIMSVGDLLLDLGEYTTGFAPFLWAILMIGDATRRGKAV